jgi:DNA polymerase-3 subunit delta'
MSMALKDVIGQDRATGMLMGALRRGRIASAYLFAGEQGIGKRFAALNFIKAIDCLSPRDGDACDECSNCMRLSHGTRPDFMLIEPESGIIKVETIRGLEEALSFKAYEGGTKAAIIDDADLMNINASNALLKTLEEPPSKGLIVLVSSRPDLLPMTIRSRCTRINFSPLPDEACLKVVGRSVKNPEQAVRLSMGSPGLAVKGNLLKQRDRFLASLEKMSGKHIWRDREDMQGWLDMSLVFMRDMMVLKITGEEGRLINSDAAHEVGALGAGATLEGIIDTYQKLNGLRDNMRFNLNRAVTWNYIGSIMEGVRGERNP